MVALALGVDMAQYFVQGYLPKDGWMNIDPMPYQSEEEAQKQVEAKAKANPELQYRVFKAGV